MTESRVREERRVPPERTSAQATRGGGPPAGGEDRRLALRPVGPWQGRLRSSRSHPTRQDLARSRFSLAFPFSQQIVPCSPSLHPQTPGSPSAVCVPSRHSARTAPSSRSSALSSPSTVISPAEALASGEARVLLLCS